MKGSKHCFFYGFIWALVCNMVLCLGFGSFELFAMEEEVPTRIQEEPDSNLEQDRIPEHHKTLQDNLDGTYTLSLDVRGQVDQKVSQPRANILLVIDKSASMNHSMWMDTMADWYEPTRMEVLKDVLMNEDGLIETIFREDEEGTPLLDAAMAVVTYSGSMDDEPFNDAEVLQSWTRSKWAVEEAIDSIHPEGGTNCEAGLLEARWLMEEIPEERKEAPFYMIFLSDGVAGYYYDQEGYTEGVGNDYNEMAVQQAQSQIASLPGLTGFYTVGFGPSADSTFLSAMEAPQADNAHFTADSEEALTDKFEQIVGKISKTELHHVCIYDALSPYVELTGPSLETSGYKVTVRDTAGYFHSEEIASANIVSQYDEKNRSLSFTFAPDYILNPNYIYSVCFTIRPSKQAYMYYEEHHQYPDAQNTGFYTNQGTVALEYMFGTETQTSAYTEKPSFQLETTRVTVIKKWSQEEKCEPYVKVAVGVEKDTGFQAVQPAQRLDVDNGWSYSWTLLKRNADNEEIAYCVRELQGSQPIADQGIYKGSKNTYLVSYSSDSMHQIITNKYKPGTIKVTNNVKGSLGDKDQIFDVVIHLQDLQKKPIEGMIQAWKKDSIGQRKLETLHIEKGRCSVKLKDGESYELLNLGNVHYQVEEPDSKGHVVSFSKKDKGTIKGNHSHVVITNAKEGILDTGIRKSNLAGMGVWIVVLVVCILGLLGAKHRYE